MKLLLLFALVILAAIAHETKVQDGITVLDDKTIDEELHHSKLVFIKFYAPWCKHCKELAPKYVAMAKKYKDANSPIVFAEVDASESKEIKEKYKIESYPTLILFIDQKPIKYGGQPTPEEMGVWLDKKTGDQSPLLSAQADFDKIKNKETAFLVYFGVNAEDPEFKQYLEIATGMDDITFTHVFDQALMATLGGSLKHIFLFKNFEEPKLEYNGEIIMEKLADFLAHHAQPSVIEFDEKSIDKIFQKQTPVVFLFKNFNDQSEAAVVEFKQAADALRDQKILFCQIDPNNKAGHFNRLAEYVGINTADLPKIIILKAAGGMNKYQLSKEYTRANLVEFVKMFFADPSQLERFLKSAPIPTKNDGPVKTIVGKSFEDEVINNNKDVLIKFYAPWCGHCKQLAPLYEAAAKQLAINTNIVIAEMDSTTNETPRVSISGFPTLKFYPGNAKDKEPVTYDGARTTEGIIDWLKQKSTFPWIDVAQVKQEL